MATLFSVGFPLHVLLLLIKHSVVILCILVSFGLVIGGSWRRIGAQETAGGVLRDDRYTAPRRGPRGQGSQQSVPGENY